MVFTLIVYSGLLGCRIVFVYTEKDASYTYSTLKKKNTPLYNEYTSTSPKSSYKTSINLNQHRRKSSIYFKAALFNCIRFRWLYLCYILYLWYHI